MKSGSFGNSDPKNGEPKYPFDRLGSVYIVYTDIYCLCQQLSNVGGRLIIASDGIWDALSSDMAARSCHGLPAELAARQVVKVGFLPSISQSSLNRIYSM